MSKGEFNGGKPAVIGKGTFVASKYVDSVSHTISSSGNWTLDTGIILPGQSSTPIKFDTAGTFRYYCKITLAVGEIVVVN